ncbi:MAG: hypothetical protein OFPII_31060 [Osedax symbiont Rs1]|nr:MAG: hypothetical protein OFPII_31060 [Osedax symbiont Rs1]
MTQVVTKSLHPLFKWLGFILLAILILLMLGMTFTPYLIGELIRRELSKFSVQSSSEILYPTADQLTINNLLLNSVEADLNWQIAASGISIDYDWQELLFLQKFKSIKIKQLDIKLVQASDQEPINTQGAFNLAAYLPEKLFVSLPFKQLSIETLQLSKQVSSDLTISVTGDVLLRPSQLIVSLAYFENQDFILKAKLQLEHNNQFDLTINPSPSPLQSWVAQAATSNKISSELAAPFTNKINFKGVIKSSPDSILLEVEQLIQLHQLKFSSRWLPQKQAELLTHLIANAKLNHQITLPSAWNTAQAQAKGWLSMLSVDSSFTGALTQRQPTNLFSAPTIEIADINIKASGAFQWQQAKFNLSVLPNSSISVHDLRATQFSNPFIELSLNSELKVSSAPGIHLSDLAIAVTAAPWSTPYGVLKHLPSDLEVSDIDIANRQLAIDFNIKKLTFKPSVSPSPFSQLASDLKGQVALKNHRLSFTLANNTRLNFSKLQSAALTSDHLMLKTQQQLNASVSLLDSSYVIDTVPLQISAANWQTPLGAISHQPINLTIDDIDPQNRRAKLRFQIKDISLAAKTLPFKKIKLGLEGLLVIKEQLLSLTIDEGLKATIQQLTISPVKSSVIKAVSLSTIHIDTVLADLFPQANQAKAINYSAINIAPLKILVSGRALYVGKKRVDYRSLALNVKRLNIAARKISASTYIAGLSIARTPLAGNLNVLGYHDISGSYHNSKLTVSHAELPLEIQANINSRNNFKTMAADWKIKDIKLASSAKNLLKNVNVTWLQDLSISSGSYRQTGNITVSNGKLSAKIEHHIDNFSFSKQNLIVDNINLESISNYRNARLSQTGSIGIQSVKQTLPITNISGKFTVTNLLQEHAAIQLQDLSANLLQGEIRLKRLSSRLTPLQGSSVLSFTNLPLNNVLALEQQPSLSATGKLIGELPFRFNGKDFWVEDGQISTMDSGYIRYHANESVKAFATNNAGLGIALKVLEDFHYDKLDIKMNYTPDGQVTLNNHLSGSNPGWQQGHPIDFSINLEENLLQLLKTLQFSDNLSEKIQQNIQRKQ